MSEQPQGPGWWQASDGRWYPPSQQPGPQNLSQNPQQQYPPTQYQPAQPYQQPYAQQGYAQQPYQQQPYQQPRKSGNRGCLIAVLVVLAIVVVGGGVAAYFIYQAVHQVAQVAGGVANGITGNGDGTGNGTGNGDGTGPGGFGLGNAKCPTEDQISSIVGSKVKLLVQGNVVVAAGCSYQATDQSNGLDVQIATGVAIIADDQIKDFESDAANAGATVDKIPVGDRGEAYGTDQKGAAITVANSKLIQVEVDSDGSGSTDTKAAAVKVLQLVVSSG